MALKHRPIRALLTAWLMVSSLSATFVLRLEQPASAGHCSSYGDWDEAAYDAGRYGTARGVRSRIYVNNFNGSNKPQYRSIRSVLVMQDTSGTNMVEVGWQTDGEGSRHNKVFVTTLVADNPRERYFYAYGNSYMPVPDSNHIFSAKDQDGDTIWTLSYDWDDDGTPTSFTTEDVSFNRGIAFTLSEVKCRQDSAYAHFRTIEDFSQQGGDFLPFNALREFTGERQDNPDYQVERISNTEHRVVHVSGSQRYLSDAEADIPPPSPPPPPPPPPPPGASWSGWERHEGGLASGSGLDATSWQSGNLRVVARSPGNNIWLKSWDCCGSWSAWSSLSSPSGGITSDPSITSASPNTLHVFAKGTDNALWMRQWNGATWSSWTSLGAPPGGLASGPDADSPGGNYVAVFARGADNALWWKWCCSQQNTWSGWASLGGVITSDPSAVMRGCCVMDVFARGSDGALAHRWANTGNGVWSGWEGLGGALNSAPDASSWNDSRLDVFAVGGSSLFQKTWNGSTWGGWVSLGGTVTADPGVVSWGTNRIDVFIRGSDNVMYHRWCEPCGSGGGQ